MCHVSKAVTFEPGTLLVPGSAADTVIQPAQSGKLPVELINKVKSQRDMLRSGASVRLAIDGVGGLQTRIRYLTQSDIRRVSASSRAAS
jgi:2-keto-4-pentenoate hydratase/2-oxohepta-3-ene-1,7-dioic acid hydratase in catechol pathway